MNKNQDKKDHYVYALKDVNGVIRYIGEGRGQRKNERGKYRRSTEYRDILESGGEIIVLHDGLTKQEAKNIEKEYLDKYINNKTEYFNLINKFKTSFNRKIKYKLFSQYFKIDDNSPSGLSWIKPYNKNKPARTLVGSQAGSKEPTGYYRVSFGGLRYPVHRVVWVLHNKEDLEEFSVIHHKDFDPSNNSVENLEKTDYRGNAIHKKILPTNTGIVGVNLRCANGLPSQRFSASWVDKEGKIKSKSFSINKYGYDKALELAIEYRMKMTALFYNS